MSENDKEIEVGQQEEEAPPELEKVPGEEEEEEPMFVKLSGDATEATEIESLCMQCYEQGITRLLLTRIPYFRDVILMAFHCPHCGFRNHELKTNEVQEYGSRFEVKVADGTEDPEGRHTDLNRQVIRGDSATVSLPEMDFEIPGFTQPGEINTIEGLVVQAVDRLQLTYAMYLVQDPETAEKLKEFMEKMTALVEGTEPFTVIVDDPSGNSFVQNPYAPEKKDPRVKFSTYKRTSEMDEKLGFQPQQEGAEEDETIKKQKEAMIAGGNILSGDEVVAFAKKYANTNLGGQKNDSKNEEGEQGSSSSSSSSSSSEEDGEEEAEMEDGESEKVTQQSRIMEFPGTCLMCHSPGNTRMLVTNIPHFKEVVVMAFHCTECGFKDNDIKAGGGVSELGRRITLKLTDPEDLNRDLLKAETAEVIIPELDLELTHGTLGGRFTTIEGLLKQVSDHLANTNPFSVGDSADAEDRQKFQEFLAKLDNLIAGEPFTLIIDDPMANSYVQNPYAPDEDPEMLVEEYERTEEQNEMFGLNDINVD